MPVFRVERNKGYTVMSNHHLRNKDLSLKAKGLLSQMLSLPEDWDYTLKGLALINREKIDAIRQAIRELEQAGYIVRSRERDERGRLRGADYVIYEQPQTPPALDLPTLENPTLDNPTQEKPTSENPTQLNKDIQSKDPRILDRDGNKIYDPKKRQYKCKSIPATDWNEQTKAEEWRAAWARLCNQALEQNGHAERVDHRSYERQGIDQIPTVHLGVAASAMEKRGIRTERGDLNREIEVTNQKLRQLKARISKLQIRRLVRL